jgi:DNA-binding NarL/FixJ family response regulator
MLVDDHPIVRTGLRQILPRDRFRVVAEAGSAAEAIDLATRTRPSLIVLDLRLPDGLAPEVMARLRRSGIEAAVVVLTGFADRELLDACRRQGASAVLVKELHQGKLVATLERIARGESLPEADSGPAGADEPARDADLTEREHDVLRLVARGLTSAQIGAELYLATNTVRSYVQSVLRKLGAHSRIEALAEAQRRRLV